MAELTHVTKTNGRFSCETAIREKMVAVGLWESEGQFRLKYLDFVEYTFLILFSKLDGHREETITRPTTTTVMPYKLEILFSAHYLCIKFHPMI